MFLGSSTFGGPFLSFIFNGILNADKGSNWLWLLPIGVVYFAAYYFSFKFAINKWDLKTPGRELREVNEESMSNQISSNELIPAIILAVGGKDNIEKVDACFTRLRLTLKDPDNIFDKDHFTDQLKANGIVKVQNGVQIIYGNQAAVYKTEMREYLGLE